MNMKWIDGLLILLGGTSGIGAVLMVQGMMIRSQRPDPLTDSGMAWPTLITYGGFLAVLSIIGMIFIL